MEINWEERIGGESESSWLSDRDRKNALMDGFTKNIATCRDGLGRIGALKRCTPEALKVPFAACWYIALAGFSMKTLRNLQGRAKKSGLMVGPQSISEKSMYNPAGIDGKTAAAFARWINSELDESFPAHRSDEEALIRVSMVLGQRALGQGQNIGGGEARDLLKLFLLEEFADLGAAQGMDKDNKSFDLNVDFPVDDITRARAIVFKGGLVFDFTGGPNVPDVRAFPSFESWWDRKRADALLVGEVKGRKDLSNEWESWMPQVGDHMRTWTNDYPTAQRVFFGTLITHGAVEGVSKEGTKREGFMELHKNVGAGIRVHHFRRGDVRQVGAQGRPVPAPAAA